MVLIGATAIEDKLQRGVPETILKLRQAGMKVRGAARHERRAERAARRCGF